MKLYKASGLPDTNFKPREWKDFRTTGDGLWYPAGVGNATALGGGGNPTANLLYALPFISPSRGGRLDRMGFHVTATNAGSGRMGIYRNALDGRLFPGELIVEGTDVSTEATGLKEVTISTILLPETIYWISYKQSSTASLRNVTAASWDANLGTDGVQATTAFTVGYSVAHTFATAYPATYPTASVNRLLGSSAVLPALFLRFDL